MIDVARIAFADLFTPPFRAVLWKSLLITLAILIIVWFAVEGALGAWLILPFPWLETILSFLAGVGMVIAMVFLITPITSLVAALFLDEIAETVERAHYPNDPPGRPLPLGQSIKLSLKFTILVILVNLLALLLFLLPGVNLIIFFIANGYLLGREYFELAAMRFHDHVDVVQLRKRHFGTIFLSGLLIAGMLAVPLLNLLTPLFATAFMVHMHKRLMQAPPIIPSS